MKKVINLYFEEQVSKLFIELEGGDIYESESSDVVIPWSKVENKQRAKNIKSASHEPTNSQPAKDSEYKVTGLKSQAEAYDLGRADERLLHKPSPDIGKIKEEFEKKFSEYVLDGDSLGIWEYFEPYLKDTPELKKGESWRKGYMQVRNFVDSANRIAREDITVQVSYKAFCQMIISKAFNEYLSEQYLGGNK